MGMTLNGRTALITGASSGLGEATAAVLAAAGCRLLLVGQNRPRLVEIGKRTDGRIIPADLSTEMGVHRVVAAAQNVDILINNAGIGWAGSLEAMAPEEISRLVAVNLTAPVRLTQAILPGMRQRQRGQLVFVSSIAVVGVHGEAVYAATKAALRAFATSVRYESEADGIGVTTVLPGAVRTPFFDRRGQYYRRSIPREISAPIAARALVHALRTGQHEVFLPRWLTLAARSQGALPAWFQALARRLG